MDEIKDLPAVPDIPFEQMVDADQLNYLARRGRQTMLDIINLPNKLDDFADARDPHHAHNQRLRLQSDLAQNLQNAQIKVDDGTLRHEERTDLLDLMREKLAAIKIPSKDD
jgi:hypothetical protein